jgi:uncharacterized membrane protein
VGVGVKETALVVVRPDGTNLTVPCNSTFSDTNQTGVYRAVYSATDELSNSANLSAPFSVMARPPTAILEIISPPNTEMLPGENRSLTVGVTNVGQVNLSQIRMLIRGADECGCAVDVNPTHTDLTAGGSSNYSLTITALPNATAKVCTLTIDVVTAEGVTSSASFDLSIYSQPQPPTIVMLPIEWIVSGASLVTLVSLILFLRRKR